MGREYVSELNHTSTLRELNMKLPFFMRIKWTEQAGRIINYGLRPKFADFLKFVKDRATLVVLMEICLEKWKSIAWLSICSVPPLHPVLPISV